MSAFEQFLATSVFFHSHSLTFLHLLSCSHLAAVRTPNATPFLWVFSAGCGRLYPKFVCVLIMWTDSPWLFSHSISNLSIFSFWATLKSAHCKVYSFLKIAQSMGRALERYDWVVCGLWRIWDFSFFRNFVLCPISGLIVPGWSHSLFLWSGEKTGWHLSLDLSF